MPQQNYSILLNCPDEIDMDWRRFDLKMKRRASPDDAAAQTKRQRQGDEEEEEEEGEVSMDLSQYTDLSSEKQTEVGIVEKIQLKNFMCHNELTIQFGPNVNFIVGNNGCGKSAVVTALVVGLGGKASVTSRGSKLKGFIKTGKQSASVEIKLRNQGDDAYKPDVYGESIIVQRKFTGDGSSLYKLKSKEGKVISQKREDLLRILDQFNIQVDNPISILNQETSKNFLNSKSPHDKYKFFLKATQLEQIEDDYKFANEQKEITKITISDKLKALPDLEKEVLKWEQKYKSLTALDDLKKKINRLKAEMAWAFVSERQKSIASVEKESKQEEERLPRFVAKVKDSQKKLKDVQVCQENLTKKLHATGEDIKEIRPRLDQAKLLVNEQKKLHRDAQMEARRLEGSLSNKQRERNSLQERIQEIQNSAQIDNEAERRERQEKLAELTEQLATLEAQEETTDHHRDQILAAITKYKSDKYKLGQDEQTSKQQMEKLQIDQKVMKAAQGSRLRRFGEFMDQLIQLIDEQTQLRKFHQKPIGPLGACFKVKDQRWALAIECCLKGLMHTFCCHDHHDENLLASIVKQVCPPHYKVSIVTSKFKPNVYDVSRMRAQSSQYKTVLDMIDADHPMVYNTLIDQRTVECVLLIEGGRDARTVMDPDKSPPVNAREAFTMKGDQVLSLPTFRYYSSNQDKARYLTTNMEENLASLAEDIRHLQQQQQTVRQQIASLDTEIRQNMSEEKQTETRLMKIRDKKRRINEEINELKNVEEPTHHDVATYEEEVSVLNEQIEKMEHDVHARQLLKDELAEKVKAAQSECSEVEKKLRNYLETAEQIKEEVGVVLQEVETQIKAENHYSNQLKEQEKKCKDLKQMVKKLQDLVVEDREKAQQIAPTEIKTRRTPDAIELELKEIRKQIQNEEQQRGDPELITNNYKEKRDTFIKIKREVKHLELFCEKLDQSVEGRLKRYRDFRRLKALRVKQYFIFFLSNRDYRGKIVFNHKNETLELTVQPAKSSTGEGWKDLKSLSGGERSFSTVCFILALWDAIESPFRCLDEFDVYMDMVNRRIAMELLLHAAKQQKYRQFIFLTPQNISNLGITSSTMKIFVMPQPQRGQPTLPFRPQVEGDEELENV